MAQRPTVERRIEMPLETVNRRGQTHRRPPRRPGRRRRGWLGTLILLVIALAFSLTLLAHLVPEFEAFVQDVLMPLVSG